jgi:hypothetical protein
MSRKVFTADEVLTAADVNSLLMDQTVMSFAGTAARGSAIPTPVEGMVTYLEDIDDLRTYNGSSWVSPYGATLIATQSFTSANSISANNVFSNLYENYKIVVNIDSSSATGVNFNLRMRAGGSDNTASNYNYGQLFVGSWVNQAFGNNNNITQGLTVVGNISAAGATAEMTLHRPFLSLRTAYTMSATGSFLILTNGQTTVTTSYDGFTIFADSAATMTGNFSVYGLRK